MNIQNAAKRVWNIARKTGGAAYVPHVIELTIGVERAVMAALTAAYWNDTENDRCATSTI
ncbi:hypothetical protein IPL68_04970 [Candidatus Saccharibacteria bacterium]|nr:MAG: hypothetical protein IPL68_04970 [Candidatus Saccharibacteria bacterium]